VPVTGRPPRSAIPVQLLDGGGQVLATTTLKEAGAPLHPRIDSETKNHLGYVDGALKGREFFIGNSLTGADIQMSFVGEMAQVFDKLGPYPNLTAWLTRMHPPEELAAEFLANYLGTWTQAGPLSGFRRIHQLASVAFTSDDHDYWNNAPHWSVTVPASLNEHLRTTWWNAAHELYRAFQRRRRSSRFRSARCRCSSRTPGSRGRATGCRSWTRSVRGAPDVGPRSSRTGRAVLGQPIFTAEAGLKGYIADWGLPDYHQYRDLVALLASTPHDIVVLTGDVHFGRVASCTLPGGRRIVELIASPALVDGSSGATGSRRPDVPDGPGARRARVAVTTEPYRRPATTR
jgi:hypothetical protein